MRATVVEREDSTVVVYDEQRTGAAMHDLHTAGLELVQRPYADPIIGPRRLWVLLAGLGHGRLDPLPPPTRCQQVRTSDAAQLVIADCADPVEGGRYQR